MKTLKTSAILVVALALGACSAEAPTDAIVEPASVAAPAASSALMPAAPRDPTVRRLDPATLRVAWTRPDDATITGFMILYAGGDVDGVGVEVVGAGESEASIGPVDAYKAHRVMVMSMRGARLSPPATVSTSEETGPRPVQNLTASAADAASIVARWDLPSGGAAPTGYRVRWGAAGGAFVDSLETDLESATIGGLAAGAYTISVSSLQGSAVSDPVTIDWAAAQRHASDALTGGPLRMYEQASEYLSALSIDAEPGGPRAVSARAGDPGRGQLAVWVEPRTGVPQQVIIGPFYALDEYPASAAKDLSKVDPNVYISRTTYEAFSLDDWYLDTPLDGLIHPNGNGSAFIFPGRGIGISQGFIVRTGASGSYHYARVLVRMRDGSLLQGTSPNRYVELEISYQNAPNVPFAKRAAARFGTACVERR